MMNFINKTLLVLVVMLVSTTYFLSSQLTGGNGFLGVGGEVTGPISSSSGGGVALPVAISDGGTSATNIIDARRTLGLGVAFSTTTNRINTYPLGTLTAADVTSSSVVTYQVMISTAGSSDIALRVNGVFACEFDILGNQLYYLFTYKMYIDADGNQEGYCTVMRGGSVYTGQGAELTREGPITGNLTSASDNTFLLDSPDDWVFHFGFITIQ